MFKRKKTIFGRLSNLTGGLRLDDDAFEDELQEIEEPESEPVRRITPVDQGDNGIENTWQEEEIAAELSIDLFDNGKEIIVQTMVAGVRPEDLTIDIRRESITIEGDRKESKTVKDDNYHVRELFWGAFSRTVQLPEEVDPDLAEATEKHGLLIVRLPKIDKHKQKKVKVKSI